MNGKVAKRIFILFIIAAFIPALALAILSYSQVRGVLLEQAQERLEQTAKSYSLSVYERMLLADNTIKQIAFNYNYTSSPTTKDMKFLRQLFTSITVAGPDTPAVVSILGEKINWPEISRDEHAFLLNGNSLLRIVTDTATTPRIILIKLINERLPDNYALIGEINPSHIWGHKNNFPYMTDFCVFNDGKIQLFCSRPDLNTDTANYLINDSFSSGKYNVSATDEKITGHRQLFLKPKFYTNYWDVAAIQPTYMALLPITDFGRILLGVIVLTLLLVILLSISQIRRTMGPLEKLINGTRKIANEDFEHKVAVSSKDEFGELAGSFNEMAGRLGLQHGAFKVLSSIDQEILTRHDIDPVIDIVLKRIQKINSAAPVGVTVLDTDGTNQARAYFFDDETISLRMNRISIIEEDLQELTNNPKGFWLKENNIPRSYLSGIRKNTSSKADQHIFTLPIFISEKLYAIIWILFANKNLSKDILTHLRELGDRVGVALSAAERDEKLVYQARHDDLTGLPNRFLFKERLLQEISFAQRQNYGLALLFIDIDRFKIVNDSFGHSAGDLLLVEAGNRLRNCVRENGLVSRLGGDEFAVILTGVNGVESVTPIAESLVSSFSEPFIIEHQQSHLSASIGIAMFPIDGSNSEDLLKNADTAMYRAKNKGRNCFIYFEEEMNSAAVARTTLEHELHQALLHDQFIVNYQPKIDIRSGEICGAEALIRWAHPVKGIISPAEFIPVVEEIGLIEEIGKKVLYDTCKQYSVWMKENLLLPRIAVNISTNQFQNNELISTIKNILRETKAPANILELEVTEGLFINKELNVTEKLDQLRELGALIAIDDFGTGYSSMSYLKQLPIDTLKIDKSFIEDIENNNESCRITQAIIKLAHILGKTVVAEGVETYGQLELLRKWECDIIQGYYFSRPLTSEKFLEFALKNDCCTQEMRKKISLL